MSPTPRLVELSVSLYRLLLAAYPAAFRQEYGNAMVQLFCDTALDDYRRRGTLGLLAVWLRTLVDFTVSVVRQDREATACAGESLSLRYLVQQWLTLGSVLLSVTILSMRYVFHVIPRSPSRTCAVASAIILLVWVWGLFQPFRDFPIKPLPGTPRLKIHHGVMEFTHLYHVEPRLSDMPWLARELFRQNPKYRNHLTPAKPWEFSFSSGYWIYIAGKPCQYSLLRIPVPVLFVFVLLFYAGTRRLRGNNISRSAMQSA